MRQMLFASLRRASPRCRQALASQTRQFAFFRDLSPKSFPHEVLGVDRNASFEEIQKQFRKQVRNNTARVFVALVVPQVLPPRCQRALFHNSQALLLHPDTNPDASEQAEENFKRLLEAYEELQWRHANDKKTVGNATIRTEYSAYSDSGYTSPDEAKRRYNRPMDEEHASRVFQHFLRNKEIVWEKLNAAWQRNAEYDQRILSDMELRAKHVSRCALTGTLRLQNLHSSLCSHAE